MTDEASSRNSSAVDVCPTAASFSAVVAAAIAAESDGCVEPFEVAVAYYYWILSAELNSDYQKC